MSRSARTLIVADHCPDELKPRPPPPPPPEPGAPPPPPPRNGGWCLHDFALHKQLGVGATSVVFQGAHSRTGLCVALKVYFKAQMSGLNRHQVQRETKIHCRLDHPNIIAMYGAFEDQDHVVLILEYASKGDLFDMLRHSGGRMREKDVARHILAPFMTGLAFMHSHSIIHRDIKLENTLFAANGTLKIADFGLSIDTTAEAPVTRLGTLDYMSPEVMRCPDKRNPEENKALTELAYDSKVDTWACGVLAFELLVGCPPFGMSSRDESINAILSQPPKIPSWLPADAASFLKAALAKKASRRPTVVELLGHPWILSFIGPTSRSSGMLGPRLHAPAPTCTSAPGAIATIPDRTHSPHSDAPVAPPRSAAIGRSGPPPPPHPRSGTPPLPHSHSGARVPPRNHHARSSAAHAFAQPSPTASSGHRGPFMHPSGRRRGHAGPRGVFPPGPPDMIPRPASAFAAHTVHAGMHSDSATSAVQPFTYHTVHAALQMWASEEVEAPSAAPVQHAPAHANSHLMQRPQPSLPPPQVLISRSPSSDLMLQHEQTLDSRMHHLTQLQSMSCAPQHAAQHAAPTQPPSPGPSGTGSPFHSSLSSGALRMDLMQSAFLLTSDVAAPHAGPSYVMAQCSSAGSGAATQGSPPPQVPVHGYRPLVQLRPHPPPAPVRAPSGGAQLLHTATSTSLSPRSSASTPMYGTTHTSALASNASCESPHATAHWSGAVSAASSARISSRHLHWSSASPHPTPQPRAKPHLVSGPGPQHLHGSAFNAPVSPRCSEELAAACAAGIAQLQCGPGGGAQQPVPAMPPLRGGPDAPDALYRDWGPPDHTPHRGTTSRQSSKRSDLTMSSVEGSMTAASLCAYEAPASHRGAASTFTASPDWVHPILMSTTSMDTMGVESDAAGMMTTQTTTGTRTQASLSSPRAHRTHTSFPRQSHGAGAHAAAGSHGGTLNLSAVAAVAGAAARHCIEREVQAGPHVMHGHAAPYRRTSSSDSRRRHGGRAGGDGRGQRSGSHAGGRGARRGDKPRRPVHSEIVPADDGRYREPPRPLRDGGHVVRPVDVPASIMWEGSRR